MTVKANIYVVLFLQIGQNNQQSLQPQAQHPLEGSAVCARMQLLLQHSLETLNAE